MQPKHQPNKPAGPTAANPAGHSGGSAHHPHDEEVVHVPKGQSRTRFWILLALTIFVLLTFTVGDQIVQVFQGQRGGSGRDVFMAWNDPVRGEQLWSWREFNNERLHVEDFYRVQGIRRSREQSGDDDVAFLLVSDQLARDAGIEVTDQELSKALLEGEPGVLQRGFMNPEIYKAQLQAYGVTAPGFEETLRRMLRVSRYFQLLRNGVGVADPAEIEKLWKENHEQFAFDYLQLATSDFKADAEKLVPPDPELDDWYQKLPRRMQVFADLVEAEKRSAVIVGVRASGEDAGAGLLAKFPRVEGRDVEAEAKSYYDAIRDRRFRRPEALPEAPDVDITTRLYLPYEEVAEVARREAPLYFALKDWLASLKQRASAPASPEVIDLAVEAEGLGLALLDDGTARSQEEWKAQAGLVGPFVAEALMRAGPTNLVDDVLVDANGFAIAAVKERMPRNLPPLAGVREKVAAEWVKQKQGELALEKLRAIRDGLPKSAPKEAPPDGAPAPEPVPTVDAEAFAKAVADAGYKVEHRDWAERMPPKNPDPAAKTPVSDYFQSAFRLFGLEDGQAAEPEIDRSKDWAFLVRAAGNREPSELKIEPSEYESLRMRAADETARKFAEAAFDLKAYANLYGLKVQGLDKSGIPAP